MSRQNKQLSAQRRGSGRGRGGIAMDTPDGHFLNAGALVSAVGVARLCQLALGAALVGLLVNYAGGHTGAPYGWLCMAVWSFCLAATAAVVLLDVTRLHAVCCCCCCCRPSRVSWGDLTAAHAALAALLQAAAAALYPVYFLVPGCSWGTCGTWRYRVAVSVCACACCLAYGAEVVALRWADRGRLPLPYMATLPGLLKVGQACAAGVIFGALANGEYSRHGGVATRYCVAAYAVCFVATVAVIALTVSGRIGVIGTRTATRTASRTAMTPPPRVPPDRAVAVYTLLATLLYLAAAVVWPIYCFHGSYGGTPSRPTGCTRWWGGGRGRCPWDAHLVVAVFTCLNLLLYLADLALSQRGCYPVPPQQPLFV